MEMDYHITIKADKLELTHEVETFYESEIKSHGNSARANVPKKHIGQKALVIVLKENETE
ncbi:hypothetical protein AKJ56_00925 [candidate division MSBL1 archaeon SCGC-AAA382N08]|uniref:Transposase n=1 Tax=candidate division MSBL1 archaeon SCGC-AAA382N08 TaxID=1698285 RepID=A0A133VQ95_9EURY|nr:hypothetical protein AKJ56_00925 [candidate division MSBL1 archaeon SCGC-AAA382N08]